MIQVLTSTKGFRLVDRFQVDQEVFYQIISNQHEMALCRQPKARKFPQQGRQRVCGDLENSNNIEQLWMIRYIPSSINKFEIIHFMSDNVMDLNEDGEIILTKGRQRSQQLFEIEATIENNRVKQENYSVIRIKNHTGHFLYLNGILHSIDTSSSNVQFSLKKIQLFEPSCFNQTYLIVLGSNRKLCLDLDRQFEKQQGNNILIYGVHYRANQRWKFEPEINEKVKEKQGYCIKSFLTKKYICYDKKQLRDSSQKDQWLLQDLHTGKFLTAFLRHKKTGKYLGVNESGKLVLQSFKQIWEFCNEKMSLPYSC